MYLSYVFPWNGIDRITPVTKARKTSKERVHAESEDPYLISNSLLEPQSSYLPFCLSGLVKGIDIIMHSLVRDIGCQGTLYLLSLKLGLKALETINYEMNYKVLMLT